jgi:hypothetical protein
MGPHDLLQIDLHWIGQSPRTGRDIKHFSRMHQLQLIRIFA